MSLRHRVPAVLARLRMSALSRPASSGPLGAAREFAASVLIGFALVSLAPVHARAADASAVTQSTPLPRATSSEVEPSNKTEAARRFDRALQLFEVGDNAGALAEFKRVYEIFPDALVLYNIGLVYAAMSRPVDAVHALERVVAESGRLNEAQLQRARTTLEDHRARVARLSVTTRPTAARIEVDGIEVGRTPLDLPIPIAQGKHVVGAVAEGYAPANKEIFAAGNSEVQLTFDLVSTQGQLPAQIAVRTRVPGVRVLLDGTLVGETPLPATIAAAPGQHSLELRRPGYRSTSRVVNLQSGATAEIALDPPLDVQALEREGATLVLDISESPVELWLDGERKVFDKQPMRLPRGRHRLRVSAAGFVPVERDITLDANKENVVQVALEPTAETRRNYLANARFHRTWGWTGIIGGAVVAAGGTVLAVVGSSRKSDGQGQLNAINAKFDNSEPPCDYRSGYESAQYSPALCNQTIADAQDRVDSGATLTTVGFVGVGVGGAILATGLVLVLTGNDPKKYERQTARGVEQARSPRFGFVRGPGQFGSAVQVAF